jgi:hypothetical protein
MENKIYNLEDVRSKHSKNNSSFTFDKNINKEAFLIKKL